MAVAARDVIVGQDWVCGTEAKGGRTTDSPPANGRMVIMAKGGECDN